MHNHDDKYPTRPGFEPGTPGFKPQSIRVSHRGRPCFQVRRYYFSSTHSGSLPEVYHFLIHVLFRSHPLCPPDV